jgi:hypothetical protein
MAKSRQDDFSRTFLPYTLLIVVFFDQSPNSWTKSRQKVSRVLLLAIHSHLYSFALRCLFLQINTTLHFYSSVTVHIKGENPIENYIPFPMV